VRRVCDDLKVVRYQRPDGIRRLLQRAPVPELALRFLRAVLALQIAPLELIS
jgi:hypothetical protein